MCKNEIEDNNDKYAVVSAIQIATKTISRQKVFTDLTR